jgi:uncharacterized protein YijF (DUF1287 family)
MLKLLYLDIFGLMILCNFFLSCKAKEVRPVILERNDSGIKTDSIIVNLTESQRKILFGAKKCLQEKFRYDFEREYRELNYKDGKFEGKKVYPGGDLEPQLGVCTDVIIRTLRYAGIVDLQQEIHEDLLLNWNDYPMKRWNSKRPDANIDHRRVPNQFVWFRKNWIEVGENDFLPGDVVIWDMNQDQWADHMGIVSDRAENGKFCIIHNFPAPGYVAEEDILNKWEITGHFRINN